ncbi:LETM1-like protein-domain-containing protein [Bipolaris maydis]|nr:LETM1-like protein-domain-containing protein [Bipolaris maydis]
MYVSRTASRAAPAVFRAGIRTTTRTHRPMLRSSPAIRILIPLRALQTESTSSNAAQNYPPPGFDPKKASQSLSRQDQDKAPQQAKPQLEKDTLIPKSGPTAHAKTPAQDVQTIRELGTDKAAAETKEEKKVMTKKDEDKKKLSVWQKVKKELVHYWDGTKLLGFEIKIKRRQLQRTVQDLARLVPFLPFVIVPFAELLLPVALKLFPNMLPSTYEGQSAKDTKAQTLRATRKDVSDFLRQTLKETDSRVWRVLPKGAHNWREANAREIIKVCKIFKDDLTLDNLSRPQLVSICRYMNITSFGTDNFLRYQIRVRMRQIKRDDRAIAYEGVETLSVPELQTACASRGIRTYGVSPGRLRDDLTSWLDLRLKHGVPSTLLVLSNAFVYAQGKDAEMTSQIDALEAVLSSIPEELYHEVDLEVRNAEGAATNKQRLEVLKEQQELINEENEQTETLGGSAERAEQDDRARKMDEPTGKAEKPADAVSAKKE